MIESIRCVSQPISKPGAVVCLIDANGDLAPQDQSYDERSAGALAAAGKRSGPRQPVTTVHTADRAYLLARVDEADRDATRRLGGQVLRALRRLDAESAHFSVTEAIDLEALGEGLGLASFSFDRYRPQADAERMRLSTDDLPRTRRIRAGLKLAESVNYARGLAALPADTATPTYLADAAEELAERTGLDFTVYDGEQLEQRDMVGLTTVGRSSEHPPCLIELRYQPEVEPKARLLFVGKTITFDSGGLTLKTKQMMRGMKYDKCGGMAVLGAMHAIARLQPTVEVIGLLPAAENAVSARAYREDDVIEYPNGVSVEITDTDYEGRLVMADAFIHGTGRYQPDAMVDLGTLTGGIIRAIGRGAAGLWVNDETLRGRMLDTAEQTGDPVWPMPLTDEHQRMIASRVADVVNASMSSEGEPCQCAALLSRFVPAGLAWAHLDIAGAAESVEDDALFDVGPTGYGTRLLAGLARDW